MMQCQRMQILCLFALWSLSGAAILRQDGRPYRADDERESEEKYMKHDEKKAKAPDAKAADAKTTVKCDGCLLEKMRKDTGEKKSMCIQKHDSGKEGTYFDKDMTEARCEMIGGKWEEPVTTTTVRDYKIKVIGDEMVEKTCPQCLGIYKVNKTIKLNVSHASRPIFFHSDGVHELYYWDSPAPGGCKGWIISTANDHTNCRGLAYSQDPLKVDVKYPEETGAWMLWSEPAMKWSDGGEMMFEVNDKKNAYCECEGCGGKNAMGEFYCNDNNKTTCNDKGGFFCEVSQTKYCEAELARVNKQISKKEKEASDLKGEIDKRRVKIQKMTNNINQMKQKEAQCQKVMYSSYAEEEEKKHCKMVLEMVGEEIEGGMEERDQLVVEQEDLHEKLNIVLEDEEHYRKKKASIEKECA